MLPFSSPSHAPTLSKPAVAGKLPQSACRGEKTNQRRHLSSDFPADHHHLRPPQDVRLVALAAGYKFRPNLTPSTLAVTGKASEVMAIPSIEAAIITLFWPIGTASLCRSGPTHLVMFCRSGDSPGPTVAAIAVASADKLLRLHTVHTGLSYPFRKTAFAAPTRSGYRSLITEFATAPVRILRLCPSPNSRPALVVGTTHATFYPAHPVAIQSRPLTRFGSSYLFT